jgi:hypothetical protein
MVLMCVDCVLASPRIAHVDPSDEPLPEVVLSSDMITGKAGNGMRQARTHTWALNISPKLKLNLCKI